MTTIQVTYNESQLNRFAKEEWAKVLAFLQNRYDIPEEDCKDIFQESFIILYNNIHIGKLMNMTSSLSTYFISICKNKAMEHLRKSSKVMSSDSEMTLSLMDGVINEEKIDAILALDDGDEAIQKQKEELVKRIVKDLPSPCNMLLWGFYRDNLSMRSLAEMFNYSSESSVKVTKHRCCEKFRMRYQELCNQLF